MDEKSRAPEEQQQLTRGGYDFVFVGKPSPDQTCSVCLLAMRNPVQTAKCGHRFCADCLSRTLRIQRVCPRDRTPIPEEGGFFPDVAWGRDILSLRVQCKMSDRGCHWTGQLRHFEEHTRECSYEDVVCCDCDEELQRRFLETHWESQCCNRTVQCEYCEEEFPFWRTEIHDDEECTRFPLECPQECGVKDIPREELESHVIDECLMTVVECPYKEAGCDFQDKRVYLKSHIDVSSEQHSSITWSELLKAKHRLNDLGIVEEQVEKLQNGIEEMKTSLKTNIEEVSSLKLAEKKLEVENMTLKKDVTDLARQLEEVKLAAAAAEKHTENEYLSQPMEDWTTHFKSWPSKEDMPWGYGDQKNPEVRCDALFSTPSCSNAGIRQTKEDMPRDMPMSYGDEIKKVPYDAFCSTPSRSNAGIRNKKTGKRGV